MKSYFKKLYQDIIFDWYFSWKESFITIERINPFMPDITLWYDIEKFCTPAVRVLYQYRLLEIHFLVLFFGCSIYIWCGKDKR
jgi:hypothetical protein